jgi:hypothetical protein
MNGHENGFTPYGDAGDPFAPETIEATIEAALRGGLPDTAETTFVRRIVAAHALPAEAEASLVRVRGRIGTAVLDAPGEDERAGGALERREAVRGRPLGIVPPARGSSRLGASLRAIAAVLVVALLGAGFVALLHGRGGRGPTTTTPLPQTPGWQNVAITHAKTAQALDFDPAQGVSYAVNEMTGYIYACGGAGHLWISMDGGSSYTPFSYTLPRGVSGTATCVIATVPGAPGVFMRLDNGGRPSASSAYFLVPGKGTQVLQAPSAAVSLTSPAQQISIVPDQYVAIRMSGDWLYATVWVNQLNRTALLGTPDFGQHWTWLDASIKGISALLLDRFAVDSADPNRLFLGVGPGPTADGLPSIVMTTDGGKTWQALPYDNQYGLTLAGASETAVFAFTKDDAAGHTALLRRDFTRNGGWQRVTQMPAALTAPGGAMVPDVGPDGTVYAVEARGSANGQQVSIRPYTLGPGATAFRLDWPQTALTRPPLHFAFALGGIWPDGQPALYLDSSLEHVADPPLYRLALSESAGPQSTKPSVTPISMPTATAGTPTSANTCPGTAPDLGFIQPGGLGAPLATFAPRWGVQTGAGTATLSFGSWPDTGTQKITAPNPGPNGRVSSLRYYPDASQHLSLADAGTIATTLIPTDSQFMSLGGPLNPNTNPVTLGYCSGAFYAAFPPGSANPTFGRLAVTFWKNGSGDVYRIDVNTLMLG